MSCTIDRCARTVVRDFHTNHALFISDRLLHNAYRRFQRVLSAPLVRHGSSVPGPMEASRRLAKRPIAGLASLPKDETTNVPAWSLSENPSTKPNHDTTWTWSPPVPHRLQRHIPAQAHNFEYLITRASDLKDLRDIYWNTCPSGKYAILFSKLAFARLLECVQFAPRKSSSLTIPNMSDALAFLESDMSEPEAQNTAALMQFLANRTVSVRVYNRLEDMLRSKIECQQLMSREIQAIVEQLPTLTRSTSCDMQREQVYARTLPLLLQEMSRLDTVEYSNTRQTAIALVCDLLPSKTTVTLLASIAAIHNESESIPVHQVIRHINSALNHDLSNVRISRDREDNLVGFLRHLIRQPAMTSTMLESILAGVTKVSMQSLDTRRTCRSWLHVLKRAGWLNAASGEPEKARLEVLMPPSSQRLSPDDINSVLGLPGTTMPNHTNSSWSTTSPVFHSSLTTPFAELSASSQNTTLKAYRAVMAKLATTSTSNLTDIIRALLSINRPFHAARVFSHARSLSIADFPDLVSALVARHASTKTVLRLFSCSDASPHSPLSSASTQPASKLSVSLSSSTPSSALKDQAHVTSQIETLAHHLSTRRSSPRSALRAVRACILFLKSHNLALTKEISRALVHAGITRPLLEERKLTTHQFRYIFEIVKGVEGDEVARGLDCVAWSCRARLRRRDSLDTVRGQRL